MDGGGCAGIMILNIYFLEMHNNNKCSTSAKSLYFQTKLWLNS